MYSINEISSSSTKEGDKYNKMRPWCIGCTSAF